MPPQRTIPPSKAIKTERTHEENQERAYIAASRRSDRSLEARVESARRASEIHKRRTGRSLRVTEQDVVNEEMYEEEDDDLPMQYRRLTAHLQTGSADFNRKLSAYLTNHVAMRSALDQAITNSYAQQYPNAPQFAHNQPGMYPSPFMHQGMAQNMGQSMTPAQSPQSYMHPPFPSTNPATFRPHSARAVPTPDRHSPTGYVQSPSSSTSATDDHRRASLQSKSASPVTVRTPQSMHARPSPPQTAPSCQAKPEQPPLQVPPTSQSQQVPPTPTSMYSPQEMGPLSTTLPPESQMMLRSALDPKDPMTPMLMGGHDSVMQSYWSTGPTPGPKNRSFHPSYDGMSATLAPSALDMAPHHFNYTQNMPTSTMSSMGNPSFVSFDNGMFDYSKGCFQSSNSSHGSGTATPGGLDGGWDAFINDNPWTENTA
ncbi:MAG: hypothetical protein LQ344_000528 [Seirophora lacunosa]|nr:MAG: hypothetical protein LQ344_000528 [Seirophora lacunosa]